MAVDKALFDRGELGLVGLDVYVDVLQLADLLTLAVYEHLPVPVADVPFGLILIFGHVDLLVSRVSPSTTLLWKPALTALVGATREHVFLVLGHRGIDHVVLDVLFRFRCRGAVRLTLDL